MLISLYKLVKKKVEDFGECRKTEKLKNWKKTIEKIFPMRACLNRRA
jgi:excinuclease UvrABC nuclease subunit